MLLNFYKKQVFTDIYSDFYLFNIQSKRPNNINNAK
jgi:hypothetical protein